MINSKPKISVIIPVYNMAQYLEESINSWRRQTFEEIEIICIDDASTDESYDILKSMAKRDNRIVVHQFKENSTAWMARKWGVLNAKGKYILFADADDTIEEKACEELYELMQTYNVDILHFGSRIVNSNNLSKSRIENMQRFVKPFEDELMGEEIFTACFEKNLYQFSLWNKMFSAELCKKALSNTKDMLLPKAQDKMAYWVIALNANTYKGVNTSYYNYFFGRGSTGQNSVTIKQFENYCKMAITADAIAEYMYDNNLSDKYKEIIDENRQKLLNDCFARFLMEVSEENKAEAFDLLIKYWGTVDVTSKLIEKFGNDRYRLARDIKFAKTLEFSKKKIKTIGTYYHSCANGGTQRVMCELCTIWAAMGYDVVVFTDEEPSEYDYQLPLNVKRVVLPHYKTINKNNYRIRAEAISKAIKETNVDIMIYHAWVLHLMIWDELVYKTSGVAFVVHCHSIFSLPIIKNFTSKLNVIAPHILADAIVTLSEVDKRFWLHWNNNVYTTINPFTEGLSSWNSTENLDGKQILWVGRLSEEKRPEDALRIMKKVIQQEPNAHMHIIGSNPSEKYMDDFSAVITELDLNNNITLHGFQSDIRAFYLIGSILLMTSEYEGYALTLQESKLAGLPIVMYELPYLTLTKNNRGIIAVNQLDVEAASRAIVELIQNKEKRHEYSKQSRAHIEELFEFDFVGFWREVIGSVGIKHESAMDLDEFILMETLYKHIEQESICTKRDIKETTKETIRINNEIKNIKNSLSFKIGRSITFIPRIIIRGIKCYNENGFRYTLNRLLQKISFSI